jgi:hypothetical protein
MSSPPSLRRLVSNNHVGFDKDGDFRGIFAGVASTTLEFGFVLLPCFAIRDQPVGVFSTTVHCFRSVPGH